MNKRTLLCVIFSTASLAPGLNSQAANLVNVYQQALTNDPTFQAARSQWLADKEDLPIKRAAVLPSLDISGEYNPTFNRTSSLSSGQNRFQDNITTFETDISEPIFNYSAWAAIRSADASVKAATATFNSAAQDLMIRVATAYFNVLQASDNLKFTEAEKKAIGRQLDQTQERYKVGLIAITDVYETKAKYESIIAQEIAAKNTLVNRIEELREITGQTYPKLSGIQKGLPLITPQPKKINAWVATAVRQNYSLLSTRYDTLAAKHNITVAAASRYPSATIDGDYTYTKNDNSSGAGYSISRVAGVSASVDFPIFKGGLITANTHQATYNYQVSTANQEQQYRSVVANTRKDYLGVLAGISQIKANKQSIVSQESALKATEAGYIVGTRTIVDVLNAQSELYSAQKDYTQAEYQYLIDTLKLKQDAGTLSANDLAKINSWLDKSVNLSVYRKVTKSSSFAPEHTVKYQATIPKQYNKDQNTLPKKLKEKSKREGAAKQHTKQPAPKHSSKLKKTQNKKLTHAKKSKLVKKASVKPQHAAAAIRLPVPSNL